jgi:WD40 repeat protein
MVRGAFGRNFPGVAVDPAGRYLYTTMRVAVKDIDQYRLEPPHFVVIDLQDKKIAKTFPFPKELDQGFAFTATYKVSPDGKLLYVFDQDILVYDLNDFHQVDRMDFAKPLYPGASPYRLAANDDPNDDPQVVTSVFTSVDPIVHKETLGLAKLDLLTRKIDYKPIGPALPMVSFMLTPDRKLGYSLMFTGAGANRRNEFWVWDIDQHKVIQKSEFPSRFNARFSMSSDGKKLFLYGAGSMIEVFDAKTLASKKLIYLNKDTTTNLITLAKR